MSLVSLPQCCYDRADYMVLFDDVEVLASVYSEN